jgi:hypothetical protein
VGLLQAQENNYIVAIRDFLRKKERQLEAVINELTIKATTDDTKTKLV